MDSSLILLGWASKVASAAKVALLCLLAASLGTRADAAVQTKGALLAAFAHPDDERVVGPLLARLAREGWQVHLVIATDGSKGIRDYAAIPAGPKLAKARAKEATCAAARLGVHKLHLLGIEDASLGTSMAVLARLREELSTVVQTVRPAAVITFGPEGGTGHPDHRLVGNVMTEIVQAGTISTTEDLFYASLPLERLRKAPPSTPMVSGVSERLLTVRIPVELQDIAAARASFACHETQYTSGEMAMINQTLTYVWNGMNYLRPWNSASTGQPIYPRR